MELIVNKKDIVWGYIAMIFNYGAGFFTLPFILSLLSSDEVGMNYLMLTISNLVTLADFGFSQQFGRNITYAFSGANQLLKKGISNETINNTVNYHLIAILIRTAKFVYLWLALIVLFVMLTIGTLYIYHVTYGFSTVPNSLYIWLLFSASTFFNFYYKYYTTLLTGSAMMMEYNKSCIYSKIAYLVICVVLLYTGLGLMSVVIANFVSPFVQRYYSYIKFFNKEIQGKLSKETVSRKEIITTFSTLWYNAKRLGIIFVAQYGISQSGIFFCGLFLSLSEIASYGLLMQLVGGVLCSCSKSLFNTVSPLFSKDVIKKDNKGLIRHFSLGNFVFWIIFICGSVVIIFIAPVVLQMIHSNSVLPSKMIMTIFIIDALLDYNHSNFTYIFEAKNTFPFLKADILTGIAVIFVNLCTLYFTNWGLEGIVIGRFLCMLCYNDWKWPLSACKLMNIHVYSFFIIGFRECLVKVKIIYNKKNK